MLLTIMAVCVAIWSLLPICSATQPTQTCVGRRGAEAETRGGDDDRVRKRRRVITNTFGGDLRHVCMEAAFPGLQHF